MAKPAKDTAIVKVSVVGLMRPLMWKSWLDIVIVLGSVMPCGNSEQQKD